MIALLFSWIIIALVFYTIGRCFLLLWQKASKKEEVNSPLDTILVGMCITSSIIAILSLWIPANTMMLFALVLLCLIYWFCDNKNIPALANKALDFIGQQPKWHLIVYGILIFAIAMFCTLHPMMTDTLYYHYQNLMWNEQYAVVPGLANLQPRLAFNSSFFLLGSTFGLKPLFGQFIFGIHTFFLATIYVWLIYKILNTKKLFVSIVSAVMLGCLFVVYKIHITSVTTDFIPNLLITYLLLKLIYDREAIKKQTALFFLLPAFIVTLKLSCFAIAIFPFYVIWLQLRGKEYKTLTLSLVGGLLIVVPWCIRNVILSGYLIFPLPLFDFFSYDWKIPMEYLIEQKEFIQSFARYPNNIDIKTVLSMPISEWLAVWWNSDMQYYNPIANKLFSFATLITIPVGLYLTTTRKKSDNNILSLVWMACVIGIVVWFFNAPDFRFIYALILGQTFIVTIMLAERLSIDRKLDSQYEHFNLNVVLTIITIIFVCSFSGRWVYYQKGDSVSFTDLLRVPTSIEYSRKSFGLFTQDNFFMEEVNGVKIYKKSDSDRDLLCFDSELPCSSDHVGGIEMRGESLQDGFRCKPNAPHRLTY